jgi:hypothetical protein
MHYTRLLAGVLAAFLFVSGICDKSNPVDVDKPEPKPSFGAFTVSLYPPNDGSPGYAALLGVVNDGPTPSGTIWEQTAAASNCRLLVPRKPFCSEPCGSGAECVEDDSCQPYPSKIYIGKVTINGIKTAEGAMSFIMDTTRWIYQPDGSLAYPPFNEGDNVTLSAAGSSTTSAFSMSVKCISPLEVAKDSIVLQSGKPVTVRWTPAASLNNSVIYIMVDISHHGGTKGKIEYQGPDNGSVTIPAELIDKLKALGYFGFPKIDITRKAVARDSLTSVELAIESSITKEVYIPGLISCNVDGDCPEGYECVNARCQPKY